MPKSELSIDSGDIVAIAGKKFKLFLSEEEISNIIQKLADQINNDYKNKKPVFIIVLTGAMFFGVDLLRKITLDCEILTLKAKSYGGEMETGGEVEIDMALPRIEGKEIIIVEDIVDSGYTLQALTKKLSLMKPNSIESVAFLSKPAKRIVDINATYTGIEIPPKFVIGYGLDYAEKGRNLPALYILE